MAPHRYTQEQKAFLAGRVLGADFTELTQEFNSHFCLSLRVSQVKGACYRMGLGNGKDAGFKPGSTAGAAYRFKPGLIPWNKDKKGTGGWAPTQFKKGNRPANWCPVGTENPDTDGYIKVKVSEPNKWKFKHKMLWEAEHGHIPKGHVLIFADKDRNNCTLENLLLVSRNELLYLNRHGLLFNQKENTAAALNVAKVAVAIYSKRLNRPESPGNRRDEEIMEEKKRISTKDVAELAGVNLGTVHVLIANYRAGKPMVSPKAKQLESTLAELGITWEEFTARSRKAKKPGHKLDAEPAVPSQAMSLESLFAEIRSRLPGASISITY